MGTLGGPLLSSRLYRIPNPDVLTGHLLGLPIWHTLLRTRMVGMAFWVVCGFFNYFRFCEPTLSRIASWVEEFPPKPSQKAQAVGFGRSQEERRDIRH